MLVLVAGTLFIYLPALGNAFISFDDNTYVTQNPHVLNGFNREDIKWAFTTFDQSNWHPLAWLSHMADVQLFGLNPAGHHFVNVLWYALDVALVFLVLWTATGAIGRSFCAAAFFAAHPLNVENVAWVAERKSLISMAFGLLAIWGYGYYLQRRNWKRYVAVVLPFALSLTAKPSFVPLPFALLIADYWPLGRLNAKNITNLLCEKVPLFLLSAASCVLTLAAQPDSVALGSVVSGLRLANALRSYAGYVAKFFWPVKLCVFYPFTSVSAWQVLTSCAFLTLVSSLVLRFRSRRYLVACWLWYLLFLVPVIGLLQVGRPAMADRYMQIPMIGLLVILVWLVSDFAARVGASRATAALAASALFLLGWLTMRQVSYWRNNLTLFQHAIAVTGSNYVAYNSIGAEMDFLGRSDEALRDFEEAWRENPNYGVAAFNIGVEFEKRHDPAAAAEWYRKSIPALLPGDGLDVATYTNLGVVLEQLHRIDEAELYYRNALSVSPDGYQANLGLGRILYEHHKYDESMAHLAIAWKIHHNGIIDLYLAHDLEGKRDLKDAAWAYEHALGHRSDLTHEEQIEAEQRLKLVVTRGLQPNDNF